MWEKLLNWAKENSKLVSVGAFFVWALLISTTASLMDTLWAIPILLLAHLISGAGLYFGWLKDATGTRSILGIALSSITMVYNLVFDFFFVFL